MIDIDKDRLLNILREVIYELTGNYYPDERLKMLEYKIDDIIRDITLSGKKVEDIIKHLTTDPESQKKLISLITVPETRFFRELEQLEIIKKYIFSEIKENKGKIKVASIGCSTGEEVYTIAFILTEMRLRGKVIGMDINEVALNRAREGIYPLKVLSQIPGIYHKYILDKGHHLEIARNIKEMVDFKIVNLTKKENFEPMMDEFDVVFCRNVLIYFDRKSKKKAIDNLRKILVNKGYLILSATEMLTADFREGFEPVRYEKFLFYRKLS